MTHDPATEAVRSASLPLARRFGARLLVATMGAVLVGAVCSLLLIVLGERRMADATAARTEASMEGFFRERMRDNLDTEARRFARVRQRACDRVGALAAITQALFDHDDGIVPAAGRPFAPSPLVRDPATGGSQNAAPSPTVIAIPPQLHAANGEIQPAAELLSRLTGPLDVIMPALQAPEPPGTRLYFVGAADAPVIRMAPWQDVLHRGLPTCPDWPRRDFWSQFPGLRATWSAWQNQHPGTPGPITALPPWIDSAKGRAGQSFCAPIWDRERQVCIGSVWCDLPLAATIQELMERRLGDQGIAFLSLADGTLLALHDHGSDGMLFSRIHFEDTTGPILRSSLPPLPSTAVRFPLPPGDRPLLVSAMLGGKPHLVALRNLPGALTWDAAGQALVERRWVLGLAVPQSEILGPVQAARAGIMASAHALLVGQSAVLLLTTALLGLLVWRVLGQMHGRMASMATAVRAISSGVAGARVPEDVPDELGLVARDVNTMADRLRDMAAAAGHRNQELQAMFNSLPDLAQVVNPATGAALFADSQAGEVLGSKPAQAARQQAGAAQTNPEEPFSWEFRDPESGLTYLVTEQGIRWSDGQPAVLQVASDITRRRQVEATLRELNATLEARVRERTNELREQVRETEVVNRAMVNLLEDLQKTNRELATAGRELRVANQELEAFSYSVSHDLRAPLRTISGFSEILLEEHAPALSENAKEHLGRIYHESQHMGQVIDSLLGLSRISRRDMHREPVDLSRLAREVVADLFREEPERAVRVDIEDGIEVWGDQRLLRIVLVNLLGNAWKFTRQTTEPHLEFGRLEGGPAPETVADAAIVYYVRDNGVGFDMQYVNKLFVPFSRLHKPTEYPGTGIGLTTVQRIVQRHGGRIWAEAKPGQGATFFFSLDPPPADSPPAVA